MPGPARTAHYPSRRRYCRKWDSDKLLASGIREDGVLAGGPVATILAASIAAELATATRHVAEGRRIVAQQRERIAGLKARGLSTRNYERTLDVFVSTLEILEEHEQALRKSAEKLGVERRRASS